MPLPPATVHGRHISDELAVYYHRQAQRVEARFNTKREYLQAQDVPRWSRPRFHHGRWHADIEVSAFGPDELAALERLAEKLRERGFEVPAELGAVVEELRKL
jgi:hypothetical protein